MRSFLRGRPARKLPPAKQEELLQAYFSPTQGIGYTLARAAALPRGPPHSHGARGRQCPTAGLHPQLWPGPPNDPRFAR